MYKKIEELKKKSTLVSYGFVAYHKEDFDFPPYHADIVAKTRGVAKREASIILGVDFTDIRCHRNTELDVYSYNIRGTVYEGTLCDLQQKIDYFERVDKINSLPDDELFYIQNGDSYVGNSMVFHEGHGPNPMLSGYTCNIDRAGILTGGEVKERKWRDTDIIWRVDYINQHIRRHVDSQNISRENQI